MRGQSLLTLTFTLLSPLSSGQDVPTSCVNLEELNIFANAVNTACCGEIGCRGSIPLTCSAECAPVFVGYMDKCAGPLADARVDLEGRGFNNFYLVCSEML